MWCGVCVCVVCVRERDVGSDEVGTNPEPTKLANKDIPPREPERCAKDSGRAEESAETTWDSGAAALVVVTPAPVIHEEVADARYNARCSFDPQNGSAMGEATRREWRRLRAG